MKIFENVIAKLIVAIILIIVSKSIIFFTGATMSIERELLIYLSILFVLYFTYDIYRHYKKYKNKSTPDKLPNPDINIEGSSSIAALSMSGSSSANVNINSKDDENTKKLLMNNYLEKAIEESKEGFPMSYIETLDLNKDEKWELCLKVHKRLKFKKATTQD